MKITKLKSKTGCDVHEKWIALLNLYCEKPVKKECASIRECAIYQTNTVKFISLIGLIAVCIYCLVMISIDMSETAHFVHWKSETMSEAIFFRQTIFLSDFVSESIFCFGLNFVSDYILQLYFFAIN